MRIAARRPAPFEPGRPLVYRLQPRRRPLRPAVVPLALALAVATLVGLGGGFALPTADGSSRLAPTVAPMPAPRPRIDARPA